MRRLGLLLASLVLLVFPAAALAAWDQQGTPHVVYQGSTDVRFDPSGLGTLRTPSSPGYITRTADNGATWSGVQSYQSPIGSNFEYGFDAAGNRAWAWAFDGSKIRTLRTGPSGVPAAGWTEFAMPTGLEFKIVVNSGGDALIATPAAAGVNVAFWPAGAGGPSHKEEIAISDPTGYSSFGNIIPYLDPSGSATVVFTGAKSGEHAFQSSSPDAHDPDSFSTPVEFSDAATARGGQGADGRGVLILSDGRAAPGNTYGQANTVTYKYASRAPGGSFGTPVALDGDDDHAVQGISLSVSPGGEMIAGWRLAINKPGGPFVCSESQLSSVTQVASSTIGAGGGLTLTPQTVSGSGHFGGIPIVAAGPDGRVAATWSERFECLPEIVAGPVTAYAGTAGTVLPVEAAPYLPSAMAFNKCGALYAFGTEASVFKSHSKQFGTPLSCPTGGTPTDPTGPVDPGGGGTTNPPSGGTALPVVVPTQKIGSIKALKGGKLQIKLDFNVAGTVSVVAKSGKTVVAKASAKAKVGTTKLQIKLNAKGATQLTPSGELKAKLTVSFKPTSGAAPRPLTKKVTFKK